MMTWILTIGSIAYFLLLGWLFLVMCGVIESDFEEQL